MYGRIFDPEMGPYAPRGALALYTNEYQPITDRLVGLGFPHRVGRCRPAGTPFSSPGCRSFRFTEGFLIRGRETILPGVRWPYAQAPVNQRSASGDGVSTPCGGGADSRNHRFCLQVVRVVDVWQDF